MIVFSSRYMLLLAVLQRFPWPAYFSFGVLAFTRKTIKTLVQFPGPFNEQQITEYKLTSK